MLVAENERINAALAEARSEGDNWRNKFMGAERSSVKSNSLENQMAH